MRTFVYVDGFNLYFRALKGTRHKWLDLLRLSELVLPVGAQVERINYYTARVSGSGTRTCRGDNRSTSRR